jgi:hypothetical protein
VHSTHAIDFLHKIANAKSEGRNSTEIEELLDLNAIVDVVKLW